MDQLLDDLFKLAIKADDQWQRSSDRVAGKLAERLFDAHREFKVWQRNRAAGRGNPDRVVVGVIETRERQSSPSCAAPRPSRCSTS